MAVGSIGGALITAVRSQPTIRYLLGAGFAFAATSLVAATGPSIAAESLVLAAVGFASMAFIATANSTLQLNSPDAMRGRVMAAYSMLIVGGNALGAPLVGWVAQAHGPRVGFAAGGVAALLATAAVWALARRDRGAARAPEAPAVLPAAAVDVPSEAPSGL
jgi:MFS family permease